MASEYQKVVSLLGENFAALLELSKKWLVTWNMDTKKVVHTLSHLKREELTGLLDGSFEIVRAKREAISLSPLPQDTSVREVVKKSYIYGFFNRANVEMVKATGGNLQIPKPCKLGKTMTERGILQENFPQLRDLDDSALIARASIIFTSREKLQSCMINAIIESEEGRAGTIPTKVGTWILGFCVDDDGTLCTFYCCRFSVGWSVNCDPVKLGNQWRAGYLLYLATES